MRRLVPVLVAVALVAGCEWDGPTADVRVVASGSAPDAPAVGGSPAGGDDAASARPTARPSGDASTPPRKSKYRKSKLTNDESEMTADRRRLLLTTGEDKAVDLEFEVLE